MRIRSSRLATGVTLVASATFVVIALVAAFAPEDTPLLPRLVWTALLIGGALLYAREGLRSSGDWKLLRVICDTVEGDIEYE